MYELLSTQKAVMDMVNNTADLCIVCVARGSLRLTQTGLEMFNRLGDLYPICMTETTQDPPSWL